MPKLLQLTTPSDKRRAYDLEGEDLMFTLADLL
jgi:hypothetical protein